VGLISVTVVVTQMTVREMSGNVNGANSGGGGGGCSGGYNDEDDDNEDLVLGDEMTASSGYKPPQNGQMPVSLHQFFMLFF
jgi:hypothetical protein